MSGKKLQVRNQGSSTMDLGTNKKSLPVRYEVDQRISL